MREKNRTEKMVVSSSVAEKNTTVACWLTDAQQNLTLEAVQLVLLFSGFDGLSALPVVLFSNKNIS
jgi:hypothetical protein